MSTSHITRTIFNNQSMNEFVAAIREQIEAALFFCALINW